MIHVDHLTLSDAALLAAERYGIRPAFSFIGEGGEYDNLSWKEFGLRVRGFASALTIIGVKEGDRVLLLAENRPEWPVAYFGVSAAGAVIVPILTDFIPEHVGAVASHAEVKAICCTAKTKAKLEAAGLAQSIPRLCIDQMDEGSIALESEGTSSRIPFDRQFPPVRRTAEDLAAIIYTSGTTGKSKGVMLNHRSILFDAAACRSIIKIFPRDRFLSVLPLAHTYECTIGLVIATINGASTTYMDRPPSPAALLPALRTIRPTIMLTVPLIIEKTYRSKIAPALKENKLYQMALTRPLAIKVAGQKLLATFGGAIRFFGIGGAALAPDVEEFLNKAGFPYAIGYGLTETAPLLAGAPPFKSVIHSTGPALEGVTLRIADQEGHVLYGSGIKQPRKGQHSPEGEIQAKGPNVMMGYYKDDERTAEVFTEDGWFRTGDLGSFDSEGRLFIRGRLKAMILGPSGENIYPEEIESLLNATSFVEESLVYAGERGELVALVVLNERAKTILAAAEDVASEAARAAAQAASSAAERMGEALEGAKGAMEGAASRAAELMGDLKNQANKRLSTFSRLHRIEIHEEPFEKTATQKIKRFLYPKHKKS